jgi:beta-glucosidase
MGVPEEVAAQQEQVAQASRGGDRQELTLPPAQRALIEAAAASGKPVVVVIVAGSAVVPDGWQDRAGAILQTFYSGMEGGHALADLLLGRVSPSGKLPFTVLARPEDYPFFDPFADEIGYGPYHGYTLADRTGTEPLYPFGHGLSYASFRYRALRVRRAGDALAVTVDVTNEGRVRLTVPLDSLRWYDPAAKAWRLEAGEHRIMAGGSSDPDALLTAAVTL